MEGCRTLCKFHVLDMTCINLPCKISIDVSLRTAAHKLQS